MNAQRLWMCCLSHRPDEALLGPSLIEDPRKARAYRYSVNDSPSVNGTV